MKIAPLAGYEKLNFIVQISLIFFALIFNPIYLAFLEFSRIKAGERIRPVFDILILISISLMYANRFYGVTWGVDGIDDAPAYISHYSGFVKFGIPYFYQIDGITLNIELVWYIFACISSFIFGDNVFLFTFFCVFTPLLLFYSSLKIMAGSKAIVLLIIMLLMQNHFIHMIFHIWRAALGSAFFAFGLAKSKSNLNGLKYIVIAIFTHLSLIFHAALLVITRFLSVKSDLIRYSVAITSPFLILMILIHFGKLSELGDRSAYVEENTYQYSFQSIFIFYIILSILLFKSMPIHGKLFATSLIMTFFFPFLFSGYGLVVLRLIEISVPLLFVTLATSKLIRNSHILLPILIFAFIICIRTYLSEASVLNYISHGGFFDIYSGFLGIVFNE